MKKSRHSLITLILFLAATAGCFGQASYTAVPINVPGLSNANLIWISDDGKTGFGGGTQQTSPLVVRCFLYQDGAISMIPTPGFPNCQPLAANVGTYVFNLGGTNQGGNITAPLISISNGQFNVLTPPAGVFYSLWPGMGVNRQGQIAGTFNCPPAGNTRNVTYPCAFVISSDGTFNRLSDLGGASGAAAINDSGDVAGWVSAAGDTTGAAYQAVIWSHTGQRINLSGVSATQLGYPTGINSKGQVIGSSGTQTSSSFFYDGEGNITPIEVTGGTSVIVSSLNDSGEVIGISQNGNGTARPFQYSNGVITDLNGAVRNLPNGLILSGPVYYINNAGQMLATAMAGSASTATQYLLTPVSGPAVDTTPSVFSVVNGASFAAGVSNSTWITITGERLSTTTRGWTASDFVDGNLPTSLGGVSVTVNGRPAYPSYISPTQLNVLSPQDPTTGSVQVQVTKSGVTSDAFPVMKKDPMPAFFLVASQYAAATHANGTAVGPPGLVKGGDFTPAAPGETIQIFGTGFGAAANGKTLSAPVSLSSPVSVTIGGKVAAVVYAGMTAPGLDQLNVTIPDGLPDGDAAILATVDGVATQANVFLTIKD
jgi:uncharacterized protein (TIGR03437 family)